MTLTDVFSPVAGRIGVWGAAFCIAGALLSGSNVVDLARDAAGSLVASALEQRFQPMGSESFSGLTGVVALGGGDERIREACRLGQRYPHLQIFISGAGDHEGVRTMLGPTLRDCKLNLENQSFNTRTNAEYTIAHLKPEPSERWLLVTSAHHMPRAIGAFRKAGMRVEPWPVYDRSRYSPGAFRSAGRELVGLVFYWWKGHTSELFPGPLQIAPAPIESAMVGASTSSLAASLCKAAI